MSKNTILSLEDLSVKINDVTILDNINLEVEEGEIWGIAGESGAGKSMTMYCATALLPANALIKGKININAGKKQSFTFADDMSYDKVLQEYKNEDRKNIAIVLQDSINALNPYEKIYRQWSRIIGKHSSKASKALVKKHICEQLINLGFSPQLNVQNMYPHELSGGMRQRLSIAMTLEKDTKLLICDEPTTSLDTVNQRNTINLIMDMVKEKKLSLIYITHNMGIIQEICSHVAVMLNGQIVERGLVSDVFSAPKHDYTKYLISETYKMWENNE